MNKNWKNRTEILIGKEGIEKLEKAKVLIYGIGGVGSFAVEGLARTGIGNLILVDEEKIDETNINFFGHIHKLCMIKQYGLNVGVDCHNFYPIDLETVLFYHNAILNHYDIEVFE